MSANEYTLVADAHRRLQERRDQARNSGLRHRPRRHALAEQFRRIADAIDN